MAMTTPTITIATDDDLTIKPAPSGGNPDLGGIYHTRSLSRTHRAGSRRTTSRSSQEQRSAHLDVEDEDDWIRDDGRKKQVFKGTTLLWYRTKFSFDRRACQKEDLG